MTLADLIAAIPGVTDSTVTADESGCWRITGAYGGGPFNYQTSFLDGDEAEAARQVRSLLAAEHPEVSVG